MVLWRNQEAASRTDQPGLALAEGHSETDAGAHTSAEPVSGTQVQARAQATEAVATVTVGHRGQPESKSEPAHLTIRSNNHLTIRVNQNSGFESAAMGFWLSAVGLPHVTQDMAQEDTTLLITTRRKTGSGRTGWRVAGSRKSQHWPQALPVLLAM